jgi:lipoyl(octanoyl) transferase
VRRASGGGAILHDREITYSFSVPPSEIWAGKHFALYEAFHAALVESLAAFGFQAAICRPVGSQRDHRQPFLCFMRRAPGDVLVGDVKIAGSAQRRSGGAVVQHGSILLVRSPSAPELPGLNDLDRPAVVRGDLLNAWLNKLVKNLGFEFQPGDLSGSERRRAAQLVEEKYAADKWNQHRGR